MIKAYGDDLPRPRVRIMDAEALRAIEPRRLKEFAEGHGWTLGGPWGGGASWYQRGDVGGEVFLIIPDKRLADYSSRVSEALYDLAKALPEHDELSIWREVIDVRKQIEVTA